MHRHPRVHIQQILRPRHSAAHLALQTRLPTRVPTARHAILACSVLRAQTPQRRPRPQNQLRVGPAVVDTYAPYFTAEAPVDEELRCRADEDGEEGEHAVCYYERVWGVRETETQAAGREEEGEGDGG
jgi:hypothetical protein